MTIDRIPLWVAMSLLGLSAVARGDDEVPAPKAPIAVTQDGAKEEAVFAPNKLEIFDWASDQDLAIFDFDQIPSVLNEKRSSIAEKSSASKFDVSATAKPDVKKDREIQHYARLFRIWTFESFRHDSQEYRRRMTSAQNVLRVWEYEGCNEAKRDELKNWFHQAALASAAGKPLPECEFLDPTLLDQIAQGIPFTAHGGPQAAIAFARAMIRGSLEWAAPKGMIGTALTMPLPFELPDPSLIVGNETMPEVSQPAEPVADLEITPATEPAATETPESKPVQVTDPALPTVSP
jgi:hypothetical protein